MDLIIGIVIGLAMWFFVRVVLVGLCTVDQNERAVKTRFGRAVRLPGGQTTLDDPIAQYLRPEERPRYAYPQVRVIPAGGPYFKMPWEKIYKVRIATNTINMALDPEDRNANDGGSRLEAVTKDQLNTGLTGQIRYRVPLADDGAPILRQGAAAIPGTDVSGVSINDLRKNLRDLNEYMDEECRCAAARYGIVLDASLITGIDPPPDVESALAAINTAHNQVSSDISLAQASADQRVVLSKRAVEIETLKAQAEVEPIKSLAAELKTLQAAGAGTLRAYLRNVRLTLYDKAQQIYLEESK